MSESEPRIESFFAVPVAHAQMEQHEGLCDELESLFLEKESKGDEFRHQKYIDTMHGELFESRFDLFRWPDPPVRRLTAWCHDRLARVVQDLNGYDDEAMASMRFDYHAWFHITRKHGYQGQHNHPNASWSGIRQLRPPWIMGTCDWRHRRGQLVLFPSYLRHEIYPYLGDRPRIVVAFNCWINRVGQRPHAVPTHDD